MNGRSSGLGLFFALREKAFSSFSSRLLVNGFNQISSVSLGYHSYSLTSSDNCPPPSSPSPPSPRPASFRCLSLWGGKGVLHPRFERKHGHYYATASGADQSAANNESSSKSNGNRDANSNEKAHLQEIDSGNNGTPDDRRSPEGKEAFSSLYVSKRYASRMLSVIQPQIDANQLMNEQRVGLLKESISRRGLNIQREPFLMEAPDGDQIDIDLLVVEVKKLIALREQMERIKGEALLEKEAINKKKKQGVPFHAIDLQKYQQLKEQTRLASEPLLDLEERLIPALLDLPNLLAKDVPLGPEEEEMWAVKPVPLPFRTLDHVKLSYINQSMLSSIIGPHANYYLGSGANLLNALMTFFRQYLRSQGSFTDFVGLDFVKSAIIEATRSKREKDYRRDSLRINRGYDGDTGSQQMHFVGNASLEAMAAFLVNRTPNRNKLPLRLLSQGCEYDSSLRQINVIRSLSLVEEDEGKAQQEADFLTSTLQAAYRELEIPCRGIRCSAAQFSDREMSRYGIDVWLPSKRSWLPASRVSRYGPHLSQRLGLKDVQLLDTVVIDNQNLVAAIVENCQTDHGSFLIPKCLQPLVL